MTNTRLGGGGGGGGENKDLEEEAEEGLMGAFIRGDTLKRGSRIGRHGEVKHKT